MYNFTSTDKAKLKKGVLAVIYLPAATIGHSFKKLIKTKGKVDPDTKMETKMFIGICQEVLKRSPQR